MLGFAMGGNHTACPTSADTATSFSDATSFVMFVNTSSSNQTLYHGSSAATSEQIGSTILMPGERVILWKRRAFHKFWATSAEVFGTPGMAISPEAKAR